MTERVSRGVALAAALALAAFVQPAFGGDAADTSGQTAATMYALNCMGCHPAPKTREHDQGALRGEFYHSHRGRNFFIRMPQHGQQLSPAEEARLLEEILTWKRSCAAILQNAPTVGYRGERYVQ